MCGTESYINKLKYKRKNKYNTKMYRTNLTNNLGSNFLNTYSPTSRVYNNLVK